MLRNHHLNGLTEIGVYIIFALTLLAFQLTTAVERNNGK